MSDELRNQIQSLAGDVTSYRTDAVKSIDAAKEAHSLANSANTLSLKNVRRIADLRDRFIQDATTQNTIQESNSVSIGMTNERLDNVQLQLNELLSRISHMEGRVEGKEVAETTGRFRLEAAPITNPEHSKFSDNMWKAMFMVLAVVTSLVGIISYLVMNSTEN